MSGGSCAAYEDFELVELSSVSSSRLDGRILQVAFLDHPRQGGKDGLRCREPGRCPAQTCPIAQSSRVRNCTMDLPLDNLILVEASLEQWQATQRHNFEAWGDGFSLADYQRREHEFCRLSAFGKTRQHKGWCVTLKLPPTSFRTGLSKSLVIMNRVLVPRDKPDSLDHIASSCETFERPIFIKDPKHPEGYEETCASICSVVRGSRAHPHLNRLRLTSGAML